MLTIKNLRKRYGNFQALDGLNLEVADGELFGFVGPNGAGKTTTLKILAGLLVPDERGGDRRTGCLLRRKRTPAADRLCAGFLRSI